MRHTGGVEVWEDNIRMGLRETGCEGGFIWPRIWTSGGHL
jgi:hypothetical protein